MTLASLRKARAQRSGFTLIEVLVVVAILALLVSILLPSLKRARQQAQKVACGSNLHQIGMGLTYYTEIFKRYPAHHLRTSPSYAVWPARLLAYVVSPTARRGGTGNADVFWCPASPVKCRWNGVKRLRPDLGYTGAAPAGEQKNFSYGLNDWGTWETFASPATPLLGLGAWEGDAVYGGLRVSRVKRPTEMFAIADNDTDPENVDKYQGEGVFDTNMDPSGMDLNEYPGKRHFGGHMMLCADAHVEFILQSANIIPPAGSPVGTPRMTGRMRQRWNNDYKPHYAYPGTGLP